MGENVQEKKKLSNLLKLSQGEATKAVVQASMNASSATLFPSKWKLVISVTDLLKSTNKMEEGT